MNLKDLTSDQVHQATLKAVQAEYEATTHLLHHLCEIERRRLYANFGCSSLFQYCTKWLKLSEPQAASRVNAARALKEFPEIEQKIVSGALSLTTIHQAQVSFKKEAKVRAQSKAEKKEILAKLENKSTREVEKILLSESTVKEEVRESIRPVSDQITELCYGANSELMADLERLREIWGISSLAELTQKMAKVCLKQCDPVAKAERAVPRKKISTQAPEWKRYIPAPVRHQVWRRDNGRCTYIDKTTGRLCGSSYRLQLDHIVPFARGGSHDLENLRLRCIAHNQLHALECFGPQVFRFLGPK